jgi:transcriptional regulator with XRE-family HTH domain
MGNKSANFPRYSLDPKIIGRGIRDFRLQLGYAQVKLAKAMGVDVKTISRLENGEFLPSLDTLIALSHVLRRSLEEILGLAVPGENVIDLLSRARAPRRDSLEARVMELERLLAEKALELHRAAEVAVRAEHLALQALNACEPLQKTS